MAKLWLDRKEYRRLEKVCRPAPMSCSILLVSYALQLIRDLHLATVGADGEDLAQKGTQLLEIYALEIQMHNETKNYKKLKVGLALHV